MSRCVIIGGAPIHSYETVKEYLAEDDLYVFCDSGLSHLERLGVSPDLIIGDFDSWDDPHLSAETIILPREKDDTDTMFAIKEMVRRGCTDFLLLGVAGKRLDHTLGNLAGLLYLDAQGCHAVAVDDYSEISVVNGKEATVEDRFSYFSLLSIGGTASGITIQHAKYPLHNAEMNDCDPFGISNEVLPHQTASITVETGRLLLIKVR